MRPELIERQNVLQPEVDGLDQLYCLSIIIQGPRVTAARAERPFGHLEVLRPPQPLQNVPAFEIVGDERVGLELLHGADAVWKGRLAHRDYPLFGEPVAALVVASGAVVIEGKTDRAA